MSFLARSTLVLSILTLAGTGLAAPPVPSAAKAPGLVGPAVTPTIKPKSHVPTQVTVKSSAMVPGERKTLEATLVSSDGSKPLPNKLVYFWLLKGQTTLLEGAWFGVTTDNAGVARLPLRCPELAQGSYAVHVRFDGDSENGAIEGENNLLIARASTHIEIGEVGKGLYGPSVSPRLTRTSDNALINRPLTGTINGKPAVFTNGTVYLPSGAVTMTFQFAEDPAYSATSASTSYTPPSSPLNLGH